MQSRRRGGEIEFRSFQYDREYRAAEELQIDAWGFRDRDVVPLNQMRAAKEVGGVVIGAFDGPDLVGFVYGFVGLEQGSSVMHSHMLAVKPSYRGRNLGYQLKLAQREFTLKQGIGGITWTFDPLQSLNAYLNFRRLGVFAERYIVDFYGPSASSLHQLGTDRLWVYWPIESRRVRQRLEGCGAWEPALSEELEPLVRCLESNSPARSLPELDLSAPVTIEIPGDISEVQRGNMQLAQDWRDVTRDAFLEAFRYGYRPEEFICEVRNGRLVGVYLLVPRNRRR